MKRITEKFINFYNELKHILLQLKIKEILTKLILLIFLTYFIYKIPIEFLKENVMVQIINIIILYIIINLLVSLIRILIISTYKIKNKFPPDFTDNFTLSIRRISTLVIIIFMIPAILSSIGLKLSEVLTSLSLFAVALVLLSKDYLSNAFNGLIIMFSNDYKLKEYIQIGDVKGRIIDVKFLNTEIRTDDGNVVFIPNNLFITEKIINLSKSSIKKIKFDFSLNPPYYSMIDQLDNYISKKLCKEFDAILSEDNILVRTREIKKDETLFTVEINVQRYSFKIENKIKNYLAKEMIKFITKKQEIIKEEKSESENEKTAK